MRIILNKSFAHCCVGENFLQTKLANGLLRQNAARKVRWLYRGATYCKNSACVLGHR